jgi:hypothetical protein
MLVLNLTWWLLKCLTPPFSWCNKERVTVNWGFRLRLIYLRLSFFLKVRRPISVAVYWISGQSISSIWGDQAVKKHFLDCLAVPKFRYPSTTLHRGTSQKSEGLCWAASFKFYSHVNRKEQEPFRCARNTAWYYPSESQVFTANHFPYLKISI